MVESTGTVSRIGIIGDVHAEDELLARAIAVLREEQVDILICTGDVVSGTGDANRCCHLLEENEVHTVRGNHDRWFFTSEYHGILTNATPAEEIDTDARAFLATLPVTLSFATPRGNLQLAHGTDTNDMLAVYPNDGKWVLEANWKLHKLYNEGEYHILVGGHSHARMARAFDHLILLNPGTLLRDKSPGFMLADFAKGIVTVWDFDAEGTIVLPPKIIQLPVGQLDELE